MAVGGDNGVIMVCSKALIVACGEIRHELRIRKKNKSSAKVFLSPVSFFPREIRKSLQSCRNWERERVESKDAVRDVFFAEKNE